MINLHVCFFFNSQEPVLKILAAGQQDEICEEIKNDDILKRLGSILLDKLGVSRKNCIVQRLRQLSRLKIKLKKRKMIDIVKRR